MTEHGDRGRRAEASPAAYSSPMPPASSSGHDLLARAARRAVALPQPEELRAARAGWLDRLAAAAHTVLGGGEPEVAVLPCSAPLRRLLADLRRALLDEITEAPDAYDTREVATAMHALDAVERAADQDAARRFASQLSDLDAMELVIAVAHDMRSPLASILFLVDTLRQGHSGPLTANQARQLLLVHSAAYGLGAMTRDLIDLASNGARLLEPETRAFSIRECLRHVEDLVRPVAEEKALVLSFSSPSLDYRVGQPIALGRVLLNLTTNALKFTEFGGVRVGARELSRTRLEFVVEDTGKGIPADVMATLFDAFRVRQYTQDYVFSSAGLGLSICQTLVGTMGGELRVESEAGRGTRFSFELELPVAPMEL